MPREKFIPALFPKQVSPAGLSPTQLSVVNLPYPALATVIGSPGAGKTTALLARFTKLRNLGISADEILVISQTRESANQLRDQLAIANQGATSGPLAKTITSLAFSILAAKAKALGEKAPELLSGSEADSLLAELIAEEDPANWPKNIDAVSLGLTGFRTELRDLLQVAIEYSIDPNQLSELGKSKSRPEWIAAGALYSRYLEKIDRGKFDSALLLDAAIREVDEFPLKLKSILVDDAQELTPAAAKLIATLAGESAELIVFGDPDVATLGFRAANPKTQAELTAQVASGRGAVAREIYLEPLHALRRAEISSALAKVSSQIEVARAGRQRKGLNPPKELIRGEGVSCKVFATDMDEASFIASELRRRHLFDGVPWQQMAVVVRSRSDLEALALRLSAESVPLRVLGTQSSLAQQHAAGELLRLANYCVAEVPNIAARELLLSEILGLDVIDLGRLLRSIRAGWEDFSSSSDELLEGALADPNSLLTVKGPIARRVEKFARQLLEIRSQKDQLTAELILWKLYQASGLQDKWLEQSRGVSEISLQANRNLDSALALFASAARFTERNPEMNPAAYFQDQLTRVIPEDTLAATDLRSDRVLLLTPSGLIGKRFDTVVVAGLIEGVWPNLKPRSSLLGAKALEALMQGELEADSQAPRTELADELRMFNKAIGSCSERLILTATDGEDEQVSQFLALVNGSIPETETKLPRNPTLRSLVGSLRRGLVDNPDSSDRFALARLALAGAAGARPESWYGIQELSSVESLTDLAIEKVTLRPSQLESYLKCPLHWFLGAHGGDDGSFAASLGTLLHEVMELTRSGELSELESLVDSRFHTLEFEADWLADSARRRASKMAANLASYLKEFETSKGSVIAREENFSFEFDTVRIRGAVDRIEKLVDGSCVIVDLKTQRAAPTEKETEENPQLALYQLAFLHHGFDHVEGVSESELEGAKLLLVGSEKYAIRKQNRLSDDKLADFRKLLLEVSEGMSKPTFIARVSSHCDNDRERGSCKLHLTKAVSYVG